MEEENPSEKIDTESEKLVDGLISSAGSSNDETASKLADNAATTNEFIVDETHLSELESLMSQTEMSGRLKVAESVKAEGNKRYQKSEFKDAAILYTQALHLCPLAELHQRAILYSNRGACFVQMNENELAISDSSKAVELNPKYLKPLLRRAKLYEATEDLYDKALEDYQKVLQIEPNNSVAKQALIFLPPLIQNRNERMKSEMIDKLKDLGNTILRPFGLSTDSFKLEPQESGGYSIKFNK